MLHPTCLVTHLLVSALYPLPYPSSSPLSQTRYIPRLCAFPTISNILLLVGIIIFDQIDQLSEVGLQASLLREKMSPSRQYHFAVVIAIIIAATYITTVSATPIISSGESHSLTPIHLRDAGPGDLPDPGPIGIDDLRQGPGGPWFYGPYSAFTYLFMPF